MYNQWLSDKLNYSRVGYPMSNLFDEKKVEDVYDTAQDQERIKNLILKFKEKFGEEPHFLVR